MERDQRTFTVLMVALVAIYVAARLWRLSDSCLWFDELFSVHAAGYDWSELLRFVAQDLIHPPLFYVLLKFWIGIGGESVFWLRLLPVLFSVLALVPFTYLCRELKLKPPVILLSIGLLAVNGALIKYTQTVRMYSMLMFMSLLSTWLFVRYFNRGKSFVPLVIANVLLVYTHYFGWLIIGAEIAAIMIFQPIKWRRAVSMFGIVAASFVPWFIAVWQAARQGSDLAQNIAWQARPGIRQLFTFAIDLVEPFYFQASSAQPASIYPISIPLLVIAISVVAFYFIAGKQEEEKQEEEKRSVYLLLLLAGVPFVVAFVASWLLPHSVWGTRHLVIILPPVLVLVANATLSLSGRAVRVAAVAILVLLSGTALVLNASRARPRHVWCEWNSVAEEIKTNDPGAVTVYAFENLVAYHLWFALRDSDRHRVVIVTGVDADTDDETYFLPRGFEEVQKIELHDIKDERIWLAFRTSKFGEESPLLETFRQLGYVGCSSFRAIYGPTTVFWMELRRSKCK